MSVTFEQGRTARLDDRSYYDFTRAAVERARRRIWASIFICDIRPQRDIEGLVLDLLAAVIERRQWGVDVRIMVTGDATAADIVTANLASALYLQNAGVPVRRSVVLDDGRLGSHAKFALIDDTALVGSQNWTDDGFRLNIEDAILLTGQPVERLGAEFLVLWKQGKGVPRAAV